MQHDLKNWQNKTITEVCDGSEAFILADIASNNRPILYIAPDGKNLNQTAQMLWTILSFVLRVVMLKT